LSEQLDPYIKDKEFYRSRIYNRFCQWAIENAFTQYNKGYIYDYESYIQLFPSAASNTIDETDGSYHPAIHWYYCYRDYCTYHHPYNHWNTQG
jgi:hypothetical protein